MPDHGRGPPGHWDPGSKWWGRHEAGDEWRRFGRKAPFVFALVPIIFVLLAIALIVALVSFVVKTTVTVFSFLAAPIIIVLVLYWLSRSAFRSWRPVSELINAAGALADGDYSVRVPVRGHRSMRPVILSFNEMAERLETSDEQRRRLLADVGHELRTPLTVVRGEIEAMLDGVHEIDPEQLRVLLDETAVMERLLEDLRTLSLAEAGVLSLYPEPIDLDDLVLGVVGTYQNRADDAGVVLRVDVNRSMDDVILDPVRIREVLSNLIGNALHAMPDGGVLSITGRTHETHVTIVVGDTGVGIPPDQLEHIFDRFRKGASSAGSGLGLTISRNIVEAHGGSVTVSSIVGEGTTVTVLLPRQPIREY